MAKQRSTEKARVGLPWDGTARNGPSTAITRRRRYINLTRLGLIGTGAVMMAVVIVALASPRRGEPSSVPQRCLKAWNAVTNGQIRRRVNNDLARAVGTPHQRMWLGEVRTRCTLSYVRADGAAIVWRQRGHTFIRRTLQPSSRMYSLAARAIDEPNVTVMLAPGNDLRRYPKMGQLSSP